MGEHPPLSIYSHLGALLGFLLAFALAFGWLV